jgi:hypothetical protein
VNLDLRPSRRDVEALLRGTSLPTTSRRIIIDAIEAGGLLHGTDRQQGIGFDPCVPLPSTVIDRILSEFDEHSKNQVTSVLSQVGAVAPSK